MSEIDCRDFFRNWKKSSEGKRTIFKATLELTARCNLQCVHCYMRDSTQQDLSTSEWKSIIDQLCDEGCVNATLTGGEPMVRSDFDELYLYLKKKGFVVSVFTNGITLTPERMALFAEWPPIHVDISVYAASRETFGKVTGRPDLWDAFTDGVRRISESHIPFKMKSIILAENIDDIGECVKMADRLKVTHRIGSFVHIGRESACAPLAHRADPEQIAGLEQLNAEVCDSIAAGMAKGPPRVSHATSDRPWLKCGIENDTSSIWIAHNGTAAPCMGLLPWGFRVNGNTLKSSLEAHWQTIGEKLGPEREGIAECLTCDKAHLCKLCNIEAYRVFRVNGGSRDFCNRVYEAHTQLMQTKNRSTKQEVAHGIG